LAQRCCEVMGFARRAGVAVAGFEKVRSAVSSRKATLLLMALDGAEGGRQKMRAIGRYLPIVVVLTAAEMGAVFGREHVVNAAIGDDPLGSRLIAMAEKLAGFRSGAIVERGTEAGAVGRLC
jgi:ribosomal protein L7Ae-like RNA K-turn-binding protein